MRYDDLSQGTPEADVSTLARADIDSLPPGVTGPATGNTISGTGTITGQAGADSVADAPGMIVAVQGAAAASATGNGAFVVEGHYGVLTIQADGSYSYVRSAGAPDGVDDVFNYTLADQAGHQSSNTLTIELGIEPPAEAVAAALSNIPGVVTLPAGVELSDVHVVGRDLVIDLPDGGQMVIPNGAVFVPQLVIGDVEVPATNLAALLIDSEPQPAAGPAPSSGGNFAVDVPPLDPGIPLGDLLPPTDLSFTPPEFEDVGQFVNNEPTVVIETPDNPAGAVNASESVSEEGLAARAGESEGSGEQAAAGANGDTSETNTGTIVYTAEDGLDSVTVNGVAVTAVGQTIQGEFGTITITSIGSGQIGYSYTLGDNTSGDNTADVFSVVVTDSDGDTSTASLTVNIADDVPTANDDSGTQAVQDAPVTVDVMANDVQGADSVTDAHVALVAGSLSGAGSVGYNGDGTFTYTPAAGEEGQVTFDYTITDGDGDPSTATVTITLLPDAIPVPVNSTVSVDDEGLGGIAGGTGDLVVPNTDGDNNEATSSGTLTANFGSDSAGSFTFAAMDGDSGTVGTESVTYSWDAGSNELTATVDDGGRDGITLFTVTVDPSTGQYDLTLVNPVMHADDGTNTENDASTVLTFTATDSDGSHADGSLTVTFDDDSPVVIAPEAVELNNEAGATVTGSLDIPDNLVADNFGADGAGTITFANVTDGSDSGFTSGGDAITLWLSSDGQTLEGRTNSTDGTDGSLIYTAHIDQAGSTYDVTMTGTIDNGAGFVLSDFSSAPAGQNAWIGLDSDGGDINADNNDSPDLLLTPTNAGGTINTSSTDIGNSNQYLDSGEGVRIDYVTDISRDGANDEKDAQGYTFDGHYGVTGSSFSVLQTQGGGSSSVRIAAYNDTNDVGAGLKTLGGSLVAIDQSSIVVTGDTTYTIVDMHDGTFVITGLNAGANVSFDTGGVEYDAMTVTSAAGLDNPNTPAADTFGGRPFAIGVFGFFTETTGDPLHMSYDLQVTDADGDTVQVPGGIDVTLDPAGTVSTLSTLAAHSAAAPLSTESSSSLLATNDNSAHTGDRSQGLGNNAILFGAVAAAGLAAEPAAASVLDHGHVAITMDAQPSSGASISSNHLQMTASDESHVQSVSVEANDAVADHQAPANNAHGSDDAQSLSLTDDAGTLANAPSELPQGTDAPHVDSAPATAITAQAVMMPSAAVMAAAHNDAGGHGVDGQAGTQVVGHVLADALAGDSPHGSVIDAVLANLPSHAGPASGLEVLASNDSGSVPEWHGAATATFAAADTVFSMETMMLHHDAVPAIHGGH